jgi:hypothetical protein
MEPSAAYTSADVPVTITGEHFEPVVSEQVGSGEGLQVDSSFRAFLGTVELADVRWQAPDRLTAVVPAGTSGGPYDLRVIGPTGEGTHPAAFTGSTKVPATLAATLSAPDRVEVGTQAGVDLLLTNTGDTAVASPAVALIGGAGLSVVAVPGAGSAIDPGQTVHLVGLVAADAAGMAQLTLQGTGRDAFNGSAIGAAASTMVQVVSPPALSASPVPMPDLVSTDQPLDLVATVANDGDVDALGVAISTMSVSGPGGAVIDTLPPPQDIPSGTLRSFHVAAHATSSGALFFAASFAGSDALTAGAVSGAAAWDVVFAQAKAQLSASWLTVPAVISPGLTFTASLGVSNAGEALAQGVSPVPNPPAAVATAGSATVTGSPAPAPQDVPGGSTAVFSWTFTAGGTPPGSLVLSAGASGTDANSGATVAAGSVSSPAIAFQAPSVLSATLSAPSAALRGDTFTVTLIATDSGGTGINGLVPALTIGTGGGGAQIVSGPVPASLNLAGNGGTGSFTWTCSATANGAVAFSANVAGTDAVDGSSRSATAGTTVAISDAVQIANAPLGATTTFAFVFDFGGRVYLGPSHDGTGGIRMLPDGSGAEPLTFGFQTDPVNGNKNPAAAGIWPTLGVTGCTKDSAQCGPDNENGRGLFGSGAVAGSPLLVASGARSADFQSHVYATSDTGTSPVFSYAYVRGALSDQVRGTSSMLVFHDRLYLGFNDTSANRPTYLVLRKLPSPPGSTPAVGTDLQNLGVNTVSGFGAGALLNKNAAPMQMVDSQIAFNDLIYIANNGGIIHSTSNDPQPPVLGLVFSSWATSTPSAAAYTGKTSLTTKKTFDLDPADKAFPQMAASGGRLYAARNTTTGPQLWVCAPGSDLVCDPQDWTLIAGNGVGDAALSQFDDPQNTRIALLAATSSHLYVGYDNAAGLVVYRSRVAAPSSRLDFEGAAGCDASKAPSTCDGLGGRGLGAGATNIFDGRVLTYGGKDYVYLTAGNGSSGFRVFRLAQ